MRKIHMVPVLVLCGLLMGNAAESVEVALGKAVPGFTLTDSKNTAHKLSEYRGKYVVLEWTNPDCPFVKKHYNSRNMQNLQGAYTKKGVVWLSICS